jgi:hypothetical protein
LIDTLPFRAVSDLEFSESGKRNLFAPRRGFADCREYCINDLPRVGFVELVLSGDAVREFTVVQCI